MQVYEPHIVVPARAPLLHYLPSFIQVADRGFRRWCRVMKIALRAQPVEVLIFAGAAVFFAISFSLFLLSLPPHATAAEIPTKASAPVVAAGVPTFLEMHIANNGLVLLRSARVVATNGATLTVSTTWGSTDFTWTVRTDSSKYETRNFGTRFYNYDGKATSVNGIRVGDLITVTGMLDPEAKDPTLEADSVRRVRN